LLTVLNQVFENTHFKTKQNSKKKLQPIGLPLSFLATYTFDFEGKLL